MLLSRKTTGGACASVARRANGVTIIPCELREGNADLLLGIVMQLARDWNLPAKVQQFVEHECVWLNNLVDRIVTGTPKEHALLASDPMLTVCEPYALFAIQKKPAALAIYPASGRHLDGGRDAVLSSQSADSERWTYRAGHQGEIAHRDGARGGLDPELGSWLERLLFEEVVPVLQGRVEGPEEFARQTLERFRNPFVDHKLADIAGSPCDQGRGAGRVPTRDDLSEVRPDTPIADRSAGDAIPGVRSRGRGRPNDRRKRA